MPVGSPKPQTIATKKYEKKAGFVSKSYKLRKEVTDEFARACEAAGVSQASQLTKMMQEFISQQGGENN
ncbi:chemotaxis protein [Anaerotruncus sp. 1XD22-93]|nr:chemotaxis protein [Lachnospiraceae bacterium]NBI77023.1 chemotaxis protein [Lachnospiraceae bacterium]RKJ72173.1 chemotaxis protein [Anaerotruncus sp. 1XD22-93]